MLSWLLQIGLLPAENNISFREKVGNNPGSECEIPDEFKNKKTDIIIPANSIVILNETVFMARIQITQVDQDHGFLLVIYLKERSFYIGKSSKREKIDDIKIINEQFSTAH